MPLADQQTFEQDNLIWPRRAQTRSVQTAFKKRKNPRPIYKCINFAQDILIRNPTRAFTAESIYKTLNVISWKKQNLPLWGNSEVCRGLLKLLFLTWDMQYPLVAILSYRMVQTGPKIQYAPAATISVQAHNNNYQVMIRTVNWTSFFRS